MGTRAGYAAGPAWLENPRLMGGAVVVLAAVVSANALLNGLVWDDPIVLTRQLLAFHGVRDLIFLPRDIPQFSPDYYRPLTILTYLVDRTIGGASPLMFHLSVVVYHLLATYLVFRFGVLLFDNLPGAVTGAALAAALFTVHPIHSESVAWGAGRSDVLACAFSLAGLVVYRSQRAEGWRRSCAAAALLFAATLAKETAVMLLVLVPFSDVLLRRPATVSLVASRSERRRRTESDAGASSSAAHYLPFAIAFVVYMAARQASLGNTLGPANDFGPDTLPKLIGAVGVYLSKLVLPLGQSAYISDLPLHPLALVATSAVVLALVGGCAWAWIRGEDVVTFVLLWMGLTLAPSLAIVIKIPAAPVAERYLYLPSVGYCLLLAYGIMRLAARLESRTARQGLATAVVLLLCVGAIGTVHRNAVWRSNLTLWQDTAAKNLTDGLPMRSLATAYQQLGDSAKAAQYFQLALQRRNDAAGLFTIYNNLGSLAMMDKRLDEAERDYRAALTSNPQAADALFNLGLIGLTRAKDEESTHDAGWKREQAMQARRLFEQAQQLSPLDPDIPVGLGQTLSFLGDSAGARAQFERALQLGLPPETAAAVRDLLRGLP